MSFPCMKQGSQLTPTTRGGPISLASIPSAAITIDR